MLNEFTDGAAAASVAGTDVGGNSPMWAELALEGVSTNFLGVHF